MIALVKTSMEDDNLYLKEVSEQKPGSNEVKIKILAAGICGTDLHIRKGGGMNVTTPVTLGHEFCGKIVAVGSAVKRWKIGDRVTAEPPAKTCGECEFCKRLMPALCSARKSIGSGVNGAFAKYLVIPELRLHHVPVEIENTDAAVLEPLACCTHAVLEVSDINVGDEVLIIGPGPMGLLLGQLVKASGARAVLAGTASDGDRLKLAKELGMDETVVVGQSAESDAEGLGSISDRNFNTCFECSGTAPGLKTCIDLVKKMGTIVQVGLMNPLRNIDLIHIVKKELTYRGSFGSTYFSWEKAISLLQRGTVKIRPLVTEILPLEEWEKGFDLMEKKIACKVILIP
jgi:L-iditol 2-dehydrogenase